MKRLIRSVQVCSVLIAVSLQEKLSEQLGIIAMAAARNYTPRILTVKPFNQVNPVFQPAEGRMMQIRLTLKPGQRGVRKLTAQYGEQLLCVRYRYDEERQERLKTVELVIERVPWFRKEKALTAAAIVGVRVGVREYALQQQVRQAGGRWNARRRLWEIRYDKTLALGLEDRIEEMHLLADDRKASANR
ncbi:MAG: hypothetical protein U0Z53_00890 [Blastocatellia bacterium]